MEADLAGALTGAFAEVLAAGFLAAALAGAAFLLPAAVFVSAFFLDALVTFVDASAFVFSLCVRLAPAVAA